MRYYVVSTLIEQIAIKQIPLTLSIDSKFTYFTLKCVNDVTYSLNCVILVRLNQRNFTANKLVQLFK